MTTFLRTRFIAAAALAVGILGAASAAQARSDVSFFVGVQTPYMQQAPVYVQPQPVYVQPAQVYVRPAEPVYQSSYQDERARRYAEWREWRERQWRHRHHQHRDWDQDRSYGRSWD